MIFKISWAADPCRPGTVWFRSEMVLSWCIIYQKFDESMFGKIITKKLIFTPNFSIWYMISKLRTILYWNHIVLDRQGSAVYENPNHWISPTLGSVKNQQNFENVGPIQTNFLIFGHLLIWIFQFWWMTNVHWPWIAKSKIWPFTWNSAIRWSGVTAGGRGFLVLRRFHLPSMVDLDF